MSTRDLNDVMDSIAGRTDELVALTQDLIRFPTVNPPGEAYRPCAEYIGDRLRKRGFQVEYVRALARPVTRTSIRASMSSPAARARAPDPACISTAISMWSRPGRAGPSIRSAAR